VRGERLSRTTPPPRVERTGGTGERPGQSSEALNAPLFQSVFERLQATDGRVIVLDLGMARTETIALLGQFRCRLDIADIVDGIDGLNAEEDPRALRAKTEALLPAKSREPLDLVLCWDLLNYVKRPQLATLMEAVAVRSRRGMLAHALVFYSAPQMPVKPGCWVPLDAGRLMNLTSPQATRSAPRYSPEDFSQCMPRYEVERARLLRNGMQEYLFRL
jgi:hypothetical protein